MGNIYITALKSTVLKSGYKIVKFLSARSSCDRQKATLCRSDLRSLHTWRHVRSLAECILVKEAEDTALILVCATDLSSKCCKFVIKIYVDI